MIDILGYYETRNGKFVKIIKIYENQDFAEGYLNGQTHVWRLDGMFKADKESPKDLIKFLAEKWDDVYEND